MHVRMADLDGFRFHKMLNLLSSVECKSVEITRYLMKL